MSVSSTENIQSKSRAYGYSGKRKGFLRLFLAKINKWYIDSKVSNNCNNCNISYIQ